MSKMHLKGLGTVYSSCGPLAKTNERVKNEIKVVIVDTFKNVWD